MKRGEVLSDRYNSVSKMMKACKRARRGRKDRHFRVN